MDCTTQKQGIINADWQRGCSIIIHATKTMSGRLVLIFCLLLAPSLLLGNEPANEVVVLHPANTQAIKSSELRSIFQMRRRSWQDGTPVRVFVLPDNHPVHQAFCKNTLGVFPYRLRKAWDRLVFTGTGQQPTQVESIQAMRDIIQQTPGAIGYLPENLLDPSLRALHTEEPNDE